MVRIDILVLLPVLGESIQSFATRYEASCTFCKCSTLGWGSPGGSDSKESARSVGDPGSIPGSGRSPGEENGYPGSFLEDSMDRGAWWAIVHGIAESDMTE